MALLQPTTAIYHHPLDSAAADETVKGITWAQTGGAFGAAKVGDGLQPVSGAGDMTGAGAPYDTTVGSAKLAYTAWLRDPAKFGDGYALGGLEVPNVSTIDKLAFSNDNVASIVSGLTNTRREGVGGFASTSAGYGTGGSLPSAALVTTIDKLAFSTDNVVAIVSGLTSARSIGVGGFESTTAGYAAGGATAGGLPVTTIDKLAFSTDAVAVNSSGLTGTRWFGVAGFARSTAGYACGGISSKSGDPLVSVSTIDKLTFSTDNVASIASGLTSTRSLGVAGFAGSAAGYACGGSLTGGSTAVATIDKLTFSTEVVGVNTSSLTVARRSGVAGFESNTAGYACGGRISGNFNTIDKLTFSDDNVAVNASTLTASRGLGVAGFES